MLNRRADKLELIRIAEAVALEKSIDKELIIDSMENGIAKAAKSKFGSENEIKVQINRDNGDIGIFRKLLIVENPENINVEISLEDALKLSENNIDKIKETLHEVFNEMFTKLSRGIFSQSKRFVPVNTHNCWHLQIYIFISMIYNNGAIIQTDFIILFYLSQFFNGIQKMSIPEGMTAFQTQCFHLRWKRI